MLRALLALVDCGRLPDHRLRRPRGAQGHGTQSIPPPGDTRKWWRRCWRSCGRVPPAPWWLCVVWGQHGLLDGNM